MKPYKHVRDKGNPLAQRFMDAMEIVGARPDKAEVSSLGNIHLSYGGYLFIIIKDRIGIGFLHGGNTNYHEESRFNEVVNGLWERGMVDEYSKILLFGTDIKYLTIDIKARYSPEGVLDQMLFVHLNEKDILPKRARSTNLDHIAMARGYLLGDTPAEVVLEYLCEVCPQINEFVYPVGQ